MSRTPTIRFAQPAEEATKRGRPKKHLLKLQDVADYLSISRTTLYELLKHGLPCYRVGAFRRFDLDDVMVWVRAQN